MRSHHFLHHFQLQLPGRIFQEILKPHFGAGTLSSSNLNKLAVCILHNDLTTLKNISDMTSIIVAFNHNHLHGCQSYWRILCPVYSLFCLSSIVNIIYIDICNVHFPIIGLRRNQNLGWRSSAASLKPRWRVYTPEIKNLKMPSQDKIYGSTFH